MIKAQIEHKVIAAGLILLLCGGLLLTSNASALQGYGLPWWTIDGGGGSSSGGDYGLDGTAGQPDPGPLLHGGDYTLEGGFWGGEVSGTTLFDIYLPLALRADR